MMCSALLCRSLMQISINVVVEVRVRCHNGVAIFGRLFPRSSHSAPHRHHYITRNAYLHSCYRCFEYWSSLVFVLYLDLRGPGLGAHDAASNSLSTSLRVRRASASVAGQVDCVRLAASGK